MVDSDVRRLTHVNILALFGKNNICVMKYLRIRSKSANRTLFFLTNISGYTVYGDNACAHQPRPQSPTGDLGDIAGRNGKQLCQGGKPGTGKFNTDVCLCGSAHTSGCMVDGLGATGLRQHIEYYCCYVIIIIIV